jgi:hypothetical protein
MVAEEVEGNLFVLAEGPSSKHPEANHRMEIIDPGNQWEIKKKRIFLWK